MLAYGGVSFILIEKDYMNDYVMKALIVMSNVFEKQLYNLLLAESI